MVYEIIPTYVPGSINSHYFHIIGDKLINPSPQGFIYLYTHEVRIPSLKVGGLPSPKKSDNLDHGSYSWVVWHPVAKPNQPGACNA